MLRNTPLTPWLLLAPQWPSAAQLKAANQPKSFTPGLKPSRRSWYGAAVLRHNELNDSGSVLGLLFPAGPGATPWPITFGETRMRALLARSATEYGAHHFSLLLLRSG